MFSEHHMYHSDSTIHFMKFDIVDPSGNTLKSYERHIRVIDNNTIDIAHVEETIEMALDALEIDYEPVAHPIFNKFHKYWVTHNLRGDYEGYVVRLYT